MWIEYLADQMTKHSVQTFLYFQSAFFFLNHYLFVYALRLSFLFIHCTPAQRNLSTKNLEKFVFFCIFKINLFFNLNETKILKISRIMLSFQLTVKLFYFQSIFIINWICAVYSLWIVDSFCQKQRRNGQSKLILL